MVIGTRIKHEHTMTTLYHPSKVDFHFISALQHHTYMNGFAPTISNRPVES